MTAPAAPVRAFADGYAAAVLAKDVDAFASLYHRDVHVFDMWGRWSLRGLDAWREMARAWFASLGDESVAVAFDAIEETAVGDLAFGHATARFTAHAPDGSVLRWLENRFSVAMRREDGAWTVVHEHTSAPIAHDTLKAILRRAD